MSASESQRPSPLAEGCSEGVEDYFLRGKPLHQLLREGLERLTGDERNWGNHDHSPILARNASRLIPLRTPGVQAEI